MNSEKWVPVIGYEGVYEVSDRGRVKSLPRKTTHGGILKPYLSKANGYMYVVLSKDGVKTTSRVHKLVYYSFNAIDPPNKYDKERTIDHINGDKTDNRLKNLRECSQSENQKSAYAIGINGKSQKKTIDLTTGITYDSVTDAAIAVGGHRGNAITRVCRGQRSNYRDHVFAYLTDYDNGTIPQYKGRIKKRSCKTLWR